MAQNASRGYDIPFLEHEERIVDLSANYDNYLRNDGFWDQLNRGGKIVMIGLALFAFFLMIILDTLRGLI